VAYDAQEATELSYLEGAKEAKRLTEERKAKAKRRRHDVPEDFLGIGVRIEDDVLVTADGVEILTRDVPVDPDEIETLAGERSAIPRGI
jgi:Xaa-Pro aminopeptidase